MRNRTRLPGFLKRLRFLITGVAFFGLLLPGSTLPSHAQALRTPAEKNGFTSLSGYDAMLEYLRALDAQAECMRLRMIGKSVQGRDLPALFFSREPSFGTQRDRKPVVLIYCQQHGNEPSGKEAALIVARELCQKDNPILDRLDLILVPQVNPDGSEKLQRRNANKMDLNRNHAILSEPEALALHHLFLQWLPEVTLDVHEYNAITRAWVEHGFVKDADEMLGGPTNLNVDASLIDFARQTVIPEVGQKIGERGFRFHRYIVGSPFDGRRIRHSTTAINDGRQSMAIYNTLSFLIEGKRYGDPRNKIEQRTRGQVAAITTFLEVIAEHAPDILRTVRAARQKLLNAETVTARVPIRMDYFPDSSRKSLHFPIFDLNKWQHLEKELQPYAPQVGVVKSVRKPYAYIFSKSQTRLIELLDRHRIASQRLAAGTTLRVQASTILHLTPFREEDKSAENIDAEVQELTLDFQAGDRVVLLNQKAALLIPLLLEPQSSWSLVTENSGRKYRFAEFLHEGKTYPIYRLMQPAKLDLEAVQ